MGDRNCTNYSSTKSTPTTPTAALPGRAVFPSPSLPAGRDFGRGTMLQSLDWRDCPCFDLLAAAIANSGPEIRNRCMDCPCFDLFAASIRKFELEIKNRCNTIVPASITARLQRSRGVQAGTGCHEGGIILSKKPPEWRLTTPQQRPASDSNHRCGSEERPACS